MKTWRVDVIGGPLRGLTVAHRASHEQRPPDYLGRPGRPGHGTYFRNANGDFEHVTQGRPLIEVLNDEDSAGR